MFVGLDDTDSLSGGCTTYLASLMMDKLGLFGDSEPEDDASLPKNRKFVNYPHLIRLNPNIPYKTRGNGAIAFWVPDGMVDKARELVFKFVAGQARLDEENTNPGIAFVRDYSKLMLLENLYKKAVSEHVTLREVEKIAYEIGAEIYGFNNGRGVIGALSSIGATLCDDHTFELLAYRLKKNYGLEKKIDIDSVRNMNKRMFPKVFDSIDPQTGQLLLTPKGYDPVFCGIRGESAQEVNRAWNMIKIQEEIERIQIFVSNQATDAHLREKKIKQIKPYDCVTVKGVVSKKPTTIQGGHVLFGLQDDSSSIECAAYEPTGEFRDEVKKLIVGDVIRVSGGIGKHTTTINLEKLEILQLAENTKKISPLCCDKSMSSAGRNKGYKCKKCGRRLGPEVAIIRKTKRKAKLGLYVVPPRARRHLTKPPHRPG